MKTVTGKIKVWPALMIFGLFLLPGCSKERVEPKNEKNSYEEMDDYYDSKKQEEQEFEITEDGEGPLIGNQGTKIWPQKNKLMYPNGDSVEYPYTVKLVELYTPKDMLYWQKPTVSDEKLLTSAGEVRIKAFKEEAELVLRPNMTWTIEMPSEFPASDMKIFYGVESGSIVDWTPNPDGVFSVTSYGYFGEIVQLGWVACSKLISEPLSTHQYSFISDNDNLDNAGIFIYFPVLKSLVQVYNQQTIDLPVGEEAKIIVTAINADDQLFSFYKEMEIGDEGEINVALDSIADVELTSILEAL